MASLTESKKTLFRKKQKEWLKLGGIWGLIIPGFVYIDVLYKNLFIYILYILACYFGIKITYESRKRLIILRAEAKFMENLEPLAGEIHVLAQVVVGTGKKEAKIDWLVVGEQGIWCVKINTLAGKITGQEKEKNWSQVLKPKNPKSKLRSFTNPLFTIQYEAKRLKEFLQQQLKINVPVKPLVVFTAASELEAPPSSGAVKLAGLEQVIKTTESQVLTPETVQKIMTHLQ